MTPDDDVRHREQGAEVQGRLGAAGSSDSRAGINDGEPVLQPGPLKEHH